MRPTLGSQVCDFIEAYLIHGPGDIRGKPAHLDDEKRALVYRIYEVYPKGHPRALLARWWHRRKLRHLRRRLEEAMAHAPRAGRRRVDRILGRRRSSAKRGRRSPRR